MSKKSEKHLSKGKALAQEGHSAEAMQEFRECMRLNPRSAEAHVYLAAELYKTGSVEEATVEYKGVILSDTGSPANLDGQGRTWTWEQRLERGFEHLRRATDLPSSTPGYHHQIGHALYWARRWEEASVQYEEALRLSPGNVDLHVDLGYALLKQQQISRALGEFRIACNLDPGHFRARKAVASVLISRRQWEETVAACQEALRISPEDAHVYALLGEALSWRAFRSRKVEDVRAAREALQHAVELAPEHPSNLKYLGRLNWRFGDRIGAERCLDRLTRVADKAKTHDAYLALAAVQFHIRRWRDCWRSIQKATEAPSPDGVFRSF